MKVCQMCGKEVYIIQNVAIHSDFPCSTNDAVEINVIDEVAQRLFKNSVVEVSTPQQQSLKRKLTKWINKVKS